VDACANIHTNASGTDGYIYAQTCANRHANASGTDGYTSSYGNTCTHIYATYIYPYTHTDTYSHTNSQISSGGFKL
jgi:hypothetical protein